MWDSIGYLIEWTDWVQTSLNLTRLAVALAFLFGLAAAVSVVWPLIVDEWRKGRDRVAKAVFIAAALAGVLYGGTKAGRVTYPKTDAAAAYLVDRGSYVTNDYVHIDFERRIVPDDAALVIERRQIASTNDTDWAEYVRSTFAAFAVPTNLPCANATNWNWIVYADWTPPPSVHTNGILEVKWGTSRNDAAHRTAGLAVGIPVQTGIALGGARLAVPDARVYTARDYVQDGLVAMWDGIENAGWGRHDGEATVWKDLAGGLDLAIDGACDVRADSVVLPPNALAIATNSFYAAAFTVDVLAKREFVYYNNTSRAILNLDGLQFCWRHPSQMLLAHRNAANQAAISIYFGTRDTPDGHTSPHTMTYVRQGDVRYYQDGVAGTVRLWSNSSPLNQVNSGVCFIGNNGSLHGDGRTTVYSVRVYRRALTDEEVTHNYRVDCARFGLGASASAANAAALTSATAAPFASAALDALTGAAPALGEAVQEEEPK